MTISKQTFRSGPYQDFIANGVKVDSVLYLSGQVGTVPGTTELVPGGIRAETRQTFPSEDQVGDMKLIGISSFKKTFCMTLTIA